METVLGRWDRVAGWNRPMTDFAQGAVDGGRRSLVLFFAETDDVEATAALAPLTAALPQAVIVGCSSAGVILGDEVSEHPVVVAVAHFAGIIPTLAWHSVGANGDSGAAGRELGRVLAPALPADRPGAVLVLADGLVVNGTALVDGLEATLPDHVTVSGGLAGDGDRFADTWVFAEGSAHRGAVAAVALSGTGLDVGYGSSGGWEGFGPYRLVTGSHGNVLHTLDDRPALALYREYLGEKAEQLPASALLFPLLIRSPEGDVELVRTVLGVDDEHSTMTFAGDIPQGWTARLMRTTLDRLVDASALAAEAAAEPVVEPRLALAVSCVGRRLVLGQRTDEEVEAAADLLGAGVPLIGFYAYGEISPGAGSCELHNQTMTLTTLGETVAP